MIKKSYNLSIISIYKFSTYYFVILFILLTFIYGNQTCKSELIVYK